MELEKIKIYRMTHIENVPHILRWGITHKDSKRANPNFITIGDLSLINTRKNKSVRVDNGDFLNDDAPTIVLGDFIPFYFGIKMPMLYVMQNGGNFVQNATPPRDIIYLVCSLQGIVQSNISYYFSDGHAIDNLTTFYDSSRIANISTIVNWNAVKAGYWAGLENLNVKRKKQAEFLLADDLPASHIIGIVCYDDLAKQKLKSMGFDETKIKVVPTAYY
jgi:hypothetical protein